MSPQDQGGAGQQGQAMLAQVLEALVKQTHLDPAQAEALLKAALDAHQQQGGGQPQPGMGGGTDLNGVPPAKPKGKPPSKSKSKGKPTTKPKSKPKKK